MKELSASQVREHSSRSSCWIVIHGTVYDVTDFIPEHPVKYPIFISKDGINQNEEYDPIHPPGTIETYLPTEKHLGRVKPSELSLLKIPKRVFKSNILNDRDPETDPDPPALSTCLSLYDFESIAKGRLSDQAWAYYSSGSDDEISMRENRLAFQRLWFRPRVLRDVKHIDYSTVLLGQRTSFPVYITATALGKLGHPDGEKNLTWAAGSEDMIQMVPTLASCSFEELVSERREGQTQWLQLYVNSDRSRTESIVRKAESSGIKALFITVDAPQLGRREKDMRLKFETLGSDVQGNESGIDKSQGAARAISSFIDPSLSWKDIEWFKSITKMPIILKGVQTWEDAVLAREHGLDGVVLSNHGGRQLDYARSGIEVLVEVVDQLKRRKLWDPDRFEVFVDGGVRRSVDVLKALCLGAKAVGIGRPFLYAYSVYGHLGVIRAIQILKDELEMDMRLIGARNLNELRPDMIDLSNLKNRVTGLLTDHKFQENYESLPLIKGKPKL
ncbi:FMN-dependent dehydrogenase-domain-containing protein [Phakopsora pachyrhizi]|uniref:L-lactate dehydrogenase (cytochrome) n=2 Tax=Phakopsora pachyrhizi TaxID=170000 RepID=A0AAV0AR27_PHAPC|nr:FMN-dependent dehydrogenase-domain-containing protein [Phakopsora pachyrhizi]CAH7670868.1 FMN-dependent dehydrogenase-domain-containing protein [Phakopsora pachyrhizi]